MIETDQLANEEFELKPLSLYAKAKVAAECLSVAYNANAKPYQRRVCRDISIAELAQAVALCVGYAGQIVFDATKLDGVARKWIDSGRLNSLGWKPKVQLEDGLKLAYLHFSRSSHSSAK